ncbi:leucyl aminopeptidase [Xylanimonas oleitrophica]|uniref:Probable cytosol aminopeptidase n=1 Tax=Xylanimonas oleitrophica TaxID=2607479 RepID=A0A2W5WRN2_9MICO|nr:leucyl aminopeptidase [Xylanimonas oleitrophica]PZR53770.1 leucyl aminopeptidase [Xylanimonas oleitrophica]
MADLTLSSKNPSSLKVDALVVGTCSTSDGVAVVADQLPAELVRQIETLAPRLGVSGSKDEVRRFPAGDGVKADVLVLTGLGERDADGTFGAETLRRAAGAAVRELAGTTSVALALPTADEEAVAAVAEGALLGAYSYTRYRTGEVPAKQAPVGSVELVTPFARSATAKAAVDRAQVLAAAVNGARDLVNTPPNDLFPAAFADAAKAAVKELGAKGVKVTVLDEKQLAAGGYGGIAAVGQGSARPPRLVKLSYTPSKPARKVALVGKGITFDTGGISLKPPTGMPAMTSDMAGAAAVLHTVLAAARLGLPVAVTGYLCLAENMPGGNAQRPGDVITIRGGKTVEVTNTDAEGRLVMADGLVSAVEDGHDVVLDIATLTGAQVIALGNRVSGVLGTDEVRDAVKDAADAAGESFWAMPMPEELKAGLKSKVADMVNSASDRAGGMLFAAVFLKEFVGSTPWAHLDIAGPAYNEKGAFGYTPTGGTGVGVRTLLTYLETQAR